MSKNVLVISTSPRKNGNSEKLAEYFAQGAKSKGNNVELICLYDKEINFCKGCLACQKTQKCVINDDVKEIISKMKNADVITFATPIYYYEMSGQMKTLLDRGNPLFSSDYNFRDIYFLGTAAEAGDYVMKRAISGLEGWIDCFEKAELKGVVEGGGFTNVGDIVGSPVLDKAFNLGATIE